MKLPPGQVATTTTNLSDDRGGSIERGMPVRVLRAAEKSHDGQRAAVVETADGRVAEIPASALRPLRR